MKARLIPLLLTTFSLAGCNPFGSEDGTSSGQTAKVTIENLIITTTENGTVEAEENVVIANELRWSVIIRSVVEEGTIVRKGELIVEFECKALEDAIDQKTLTLNNAELTLEQAKKDLTMAEKQQVFYVEQAVNGLSDAKDALERYTSDGGEKEKSLKDADRAIMMGEKQLKIAKEKLTFKKNVNKDPELNKPYSKSEIESDELNVQSLENTLEKAKEAKKLLIKYDIPQRVRKLETSVKEAQLNLEKTELSKETTLKWKQQEIKGKQTQLEQHQEQMNELREDEEKLKVHAEKAGLVLYNPGWKAEGVRIQVKEGEQIYPRQKLLEIPDMTTLRVKTMLFEALKEYIKVEGGPSKPAEGAPLMKNNNGSHAQKGTEALVVLDAFAQKTQLSGRVIESSPLPKNTGPQWLRTGTKAYDLYIAVNWEEYGLVPGKNLRPGMGGKVILFLDEIENALTIPVLSVYNKKNRYYCRKLVDGSSIETEITIGKMNESRVQVLSGLKEGDKVQLIAKAEKKAAPEEADVETEGDAASEGMANEEEA